LAIEPNILLNESHVPANVFFIKLPAPSIMANPVSNGPLTKSAYGLSIKSTTPDEIFLNNPVGLPNILIEPISFKIVVPIPNL
jgi:hypothetical protein